MTNLKNPSNDAYNDVTLRLSSLLPVTLAVETKWDNTARTVVRQDYGPEWYWADFRLAIPMLLDMMYCVSYPVDVIFNMAADSHVDWYGAEQHSEWFAAQWPKSYHNRVVVVANPRDFAHIHLLFSPIKPWPYLVKSLDDARAVLQNGRTRMTSLLD